MSEKDHAHCIMKDFPLKVKNSFQYLCGTILNYISTSDGRIL